MARYRRSFESGHRGFTLLELLVAMAVLSILTVLLINVVSTTSQMWGMGERHNQTRAKSRALLDFVGRELKEAVLARDSSKDSLQFVINQNSLGSDFANRDNIFWQSPIATEASQGDLAEIGYFVQWISGRPTLCRFFVNPSETNHLIYTQPTAWLSENLVKSVAPADKADQYKGLFLENILGLWVHAYQADGTPYAGNSRLTQKLPSTVEISIVAIDDATSQHLDPYVSTIQALYGKSTAEDFLAALPGVIREGAVVSSVTVSLENTK